MADNEVAEPDVKDEDKFLNTEQSMHTTVETMNKPEPSEERIGSEEASEVEPVLTTADTVVLQRLDK